MTNDRMKSFYYRWDKAKIDLRLATLLFLMFARGQQSVRKFYLEVAVRRSKKVFFKISQNSKESICSGATFYQVATLNICNLIKKRV